MSPLTIWKDKVAIQSFKHNSAKLELTYAMEDIIPYIGWDLDWMEHKLFTILLQQSMDYLNHFGGYKREMLQLRIIILLLVSIELVLSFILINLQVEMVENLKNNLVIFTEAHTLQLLMDQEPLLFQEQAMESLSVK